MPEPEQSRTRFRLVLAAAFAGYALLRIATTRPSDMGAPGVWWIDPLLWAVLDIGLLYVAVRLAKRYPLGRGQPLRHIVPHTIAAAVYVIGTVAAESLELAADITTRHRSLPSGVISRFLSYVLFAGIAHAIEYLRRYRASQLASLQMERDLAIMQRRQAEARLHALRTELNPELFSDALQRVSRLTHQDVNSAQRGIAEIGDIMRSALSKAHDTHASLEEEIDALEPYLRLLRERYGDQMRFERQLPDELRDVTVPRASLQFLVDQALRLYGHAADWISIAVKADHPDASPDRLRLEVWVRREPPLRSQRHASIVERAASRVSEFYGRNAMLELIENAAGGGIRLTIPLEAGERNAETPAESAEGRARRGIPIPAMLRVAAFFTLCFTVAAVAVYRTLMGRGSATPVVGAIAQAALFAALMTASLVIAARLTRAARRWHVHLKAAGAVALAYGIGGAFMPYFTALAVTPAALARTVVGAALIYGLVATIMAAIDYARRYRSAEAAEARLRTELADTARARAQVQLHALKMELNPHFLGNALSTASSLIRRDPEAARRLIGQLDELLRSALARVAVQETSLAEEIEGLQPFIAFERARLGDRLSVTWDIADGMLDARVPHMILQPLIENAVTHGLSARGSGRIVVTGRRAGEKLQLSVRDDGVGIQRTSTRKSGGGVGLANTRARLEALYGNQASLDLDSATGQGTVANVTLPYIPG